MVCPTEGHTVPSKPGKTAESVTQNVLAKVVNNTNECSSEPRDSASLSQVIKHASGDDKDVGLPKPRGCLASLRALSFLLH